MKPHHQVILWLCASVVSFTAAVVSMARFLAGGHGAWLPMSVFNILGFLAGLYLAIAIAIENDLL